MTLFVEPTLALQAALGTRLASSAAVTNLVPADNIRADCARPEVFPSILLGDGYVVDESKSFPRRHVRAFCDIHVWTQEAGMSGAKSIVGVIVSKLTNARLTFSDQTPFRCVDSQISQWRTMRDLDVRYAHGIVTYQALVELPAWNDNGIGDWEDTMRWLEL